MSRQSRPSSAIGIPVQEMKAAGYTCGASRAEQRLFMERQGATLKTFMERHD